MKDGETAVRELTEERRSWQRLRWEWPSRVSDSLSWPTSGVWPRSPRKKAANTQTSSLGVWLQLCCAWSTIPLGNPTEIFGWGFGTTGEETSSSPLPVWRALYKFKLCWLNTSAVQTPSIRLVAHTHGSQGSQRDCQKRTVRWAGAQSSSSWHKLQQILLFRSAAASCGSFPMDRWNLLFSLRRVTNLFSYINTLLLLSE